MAMTNALRAGALLAALVMVALPASAQDPASPDAAADTLLFPSWSERIALVGLGAEQTPLTQWAPLERARPRRLCFAAGATGYAAGMLADAVRSEPVRWPPGFDYFPALSWRSLPDLGAALGKALVCPQPLARSPTDVAAPPGPARRQER